MLAKPLKMAGVTGLEPAASGVTGRRSNQLSYTPYRAVVHGRRRSSACTASDSPSQGEARDAPLRWSPRANLAFADGVMRRSARSRMVGGDSLELPTSWV